MFSDRVGYMQSFERRMASLRDRAENAKAQLDEANVRHESEEGELAITVNLSGGLVDIEFSPQARHLSMQGLRSLILESYQSATAEASQKSLSVMSDFLGEDSAAMSVIRENLDRYSPKGG